MASRRLPPWGIVVFLAYGLAILAGIGLTLQRVIDQATEMAVSLPGVVDMVLLAYTIFTITLVIQRKEAARNLALGLTSLTLPVVVFAVLWGLLPVALFFGILAWLLFRGLRRPATIAWLSEP
jgi:succinate-acetate transporter protein